MPKSKEKSVVKFNQDQGRKFIIQPRSHKQKDYLRALNEEAVVIALGPAGTGKTFCAAAWAGQQLTRNNIEKIILTRANVPTGKSIGYFPGTIEEKLEPWLAPVTSIIKDVIGKGAYECQIKKGNIEMIPLETIRGRSWDNTIILVDEAQNLTIEEIKAVSTRIGEGSRMVFMGDASQSDLKNGKENALNKFCDLVEKYSIDGTRIIEFGVDDIVRSDICAALVEAFYKEGI